MQSLKEELLELLEKDKEFRYAVAGLIGYKEILERITSLEEGQQRLEERIVSLEERITSLEEGQQRLEEGQQSLRRLVNVIAHRFGIISEESFREGMKYVLEEEFGVADVGRFIMEDEKGIVYNHPSTVEVDVLVKDGKHILIEIKSRVSKGDVAELYKIGQLYSEKIGVKPSLVIIGGLIDKGAEELAKELGVKIKPTIEEEVE